MPTDALTTHARKPGRNHPADPSLRAAEARRREIMALLEEIRADRPSPAEVVAAIRRASNGELTPERLQRIAGSVLALYR
ncbi:MAG TPA: hypothetical protein VHG30_04690 [Microvirga sp.]|jgi:hypothetical protein|nr:hypothetical protein [Microvirga sp.]